MKILVLSLISVLSLASGSAQSRYPQPENMQTFHIVLLMKGPTSTGGPSTPELQKLQEAHLAHLTKLAKDGHAVIAGPMEGDGDVRGIVILKAASADAARALEADDPAVKAGRLKIEIVSYMAPANWFTFGPIPADYKMRQFFFGFLNAGPNMNRTPAEMQKLQDDHLANLWAMRDVGALVMAGPVMNAQVHAGMFVLAVDTAEKAKALLEQDPGVKAGRFVIEMYRWYAADGIMKGR